MSESDLFDENVPDPAAARGSPASDREPLATRMRPRALDDVLGQDHLLAPGRLLRRVIEADRLTNLIFFGPPGSGKTTLAEVIARSTRRRFERTSGVVANVAILRGICEAARARRDPAGVVLFIDEIHRFNKAQQDILLPYIEQGCITLIGATTHNPNVFINSPLTSRSLVFELRPLDEPAVIRLVRRALADPERGLGHQPCEIDDETLGFLAIVCEGDARRALNAVEIAARSTPPAPDGVTRVTRAIMEESVQRRMTLYDRDEDGHYDTISAFIKSVRGSDPHAAIYWLAKMIEAGEDPRFIARRLIILASEDIGNADPRGLTVAVAAMQAVEFIGMPEARITLAQATAYLATAPKSNASYLAVDAALSDVRSARKLDVPEPLRNMKVRAIGREGIDAAYLYPHDFPEATVRQAYLPVARRYYHPTHQGYEETIAKRMERTERLKKESPHDSD